jgi:hypothetical protein
MWLLIVLAAVVLLLVAYRIHRDGYHRPHRGGAMDRGQAGRDKGQMY